MIFLTVGTHTKGFDRLIKAADDMARCIDETVVIQRGSSTYKPIYALSFDWATSQEIEERMKQARVIITQAGAGSIIQALKIGKPIVVIPRLKHYGEHHNDHQKQLAHALNNEGRALTIEVLNEDSLRQAVEQAERLDPISGSATNLVNALNKQLKIWSTERS